MGLDPLREEAGPEDDPDSGNIYQGGEMIAIVNIDKNVRKSGPHEYELRINNFVVTRFTHNREEPLHECLMRAAIAAQEKRKPDSRGMVRPFLDPRYDDAFSKGLEALNKM